MEKELSQLKTVLLRIPDQSLVRLLVKSFVYQAGREARIAALDQAILKLTVANYNAAASSPKKEPPPPEPEEKEWGADE